MMPSSASSPGESGSMEGAAGPGASAPPRSPASANGVRIRPAGPVSGRLAAPGSKSMTIRRLVLAALAPGESVLTGPLEADDTMAVRGAVAALGAAVRPLERDSGPSGNGTRRDWIVTGTGGALQAPGAAVDCRMSGTTLRIMTAVATHAAGPVTVTGDKALRRRPIGALVEAMRLLGARLTDANGYPPVRVEGGGFPGGHVTIDVTGSSQFASAILLAAPLAAGAVELRATGSAASAYIDLTVEALGDAGVQVEADAWPPRDGARGVAGGDPGDRWWRVSPAMPRAGAFRVDHDASAACHLLALAMATGGTVTITNAGPTRQPDAGLTTVFAAMGGTITHDGDHLTVTGPRRLLPVDVDLSAMPDQVTTVAALAALAAGDSWIHGVGVTRGHETDRLTALATELTKVGAEVTEEPDGLRISGVRNRRSPGRDATIRLATYKDHRLAMAFTALGARLPGIVIDDPNCVAKTYPAFWHDVSGLGVSVAVED